ncbi:hypothetical protein [Sanyastnella coralliicola]|uniref:hypothetical protein n=1 Tax=Sanyastnella coralliicola TaxID=3069118 RepID=UPI0027BA30EC|nr:hypothetical protein [Longitalea sp. SCSIO 12813]
MNVLKADIEKGKIMNTNAGCRKKNGRRMPDAGKKRTPDAGRRKKTDAGCRTPDPTFLRKK